MIRATTFSSLVTVLMLVLYLPSSQTPGRFLSQLSLEHRRNLAFWGEPTAERIFDRMLTLLDHAQAHSPVPIASDTSRTSGTLGTSGARADSSASIPTSTPDRANNLNNVLTAGKPARGPAASAAQAGVAPAVEQEMARVSERLFNNSYFGSIDALLALASYRLATLLEWVVPSCPLALALLIDAMLGRSTRSREFRPHDPELFALYASLAIVSLCACTIAMVWPWSLSPAAWAMVPSAVAFLLARAVAHFHRRAS